MCILHKLVHELGDGGETPRADPGERTLPPEPGSVITDSGGTKAIRRNGKTSDNFINIEELVFSTNYFSKLSINLLILTITSLNCSEKFAKFSKLQTSLSIKFN